MSTVLDAADVAKRELDQTAFNLAVWRALLADPELADLPFRIETDAHGQMIMSPPPAPNHGSKQSEIARWLGNWNTEGKVLTECPISTSQGVKAADVAWCTQELWQKTEQDVCFVKSPQICVEVLSPSNTASEIDEKKHLYFEAGALEVWICAIDGSMCHFLRAKPDDAATTSDLCPDFPASVD